MSEKELEEQLKQYQEMAKADPKIDVAALMVDALNKHQDQQLPINQKRWGYLVSLIAPPFGLIFAVYFYFTGKEDGKQAAAICAVLTVLSLLLFVLFFKLLISGSGLDESQLQEINPSQIQQLLE